MVAAPYKKVHLVGVGGAGMSGIARILLARGVTVSGSDAKHSRVLDALTALGGRMHVGHDAGQVADAEVVVVSTAIRSDNPEVIEAHRRGLSVLPRAAALSSLMVGRRAIAVAGTHGKTTTTSMLTVALQHCGADPSFAIGGDLNEAGSNAHHGTGDVFVAEADESDGSFLLYSPYAAIVTNVEADHLDHHGDEAAVYRAFADFTALVDPAGFLVVCGDDKGAMDAAAACDARVRTYGVGESADLRVTDVVLRGLGSTSEVFYLGQRLGTLRLSVPGHHNVLNAAAALAVGLELGMPAGELQEGLASFTGARRRFDLRGEVGGVRVFDDYSHHPTEVSVALRTARTVAAGGRVLVAFQPHLYSRTQVFAERFGEARRLADVVIVMEVYGAREDPIPGVTGRTIADAVPLPPGDVVFEPSWLAVAGHVLARARPGDVVLTMGAGDVTQLGPEILAGLAGQP
ncbi:MAG TPA: UDP-N-acetylmuramate--L-alanine ligase [Mycobacteriales bacterium]|nr:UDP-N-acetylmuramate--L-alanine ligase [Mycobacteriales bacterium]